MAKAKTSLLQQDGKIVEAGKGGKILQDLTPKGTNIPEPSKENNAAIIVGCRSFGSELNALFKKLFSSIPVAWGHKDYAEFFAERRRHYIIGRMARSLNNDAPAPTEALIEHARYLFSLHGATSKKRDKRSKYQELIYGRARTKFSRMLDDAGIENPTPSNNEKSRV